jgi:HAD superfamily phosphatase (TIGR01668 family)
MNLLYPDIIVGRINDIDLNILKDKNIKGLIVDIDNTLVAWDVKEADEAAIQWIDKIKDSGLKICLVSNNSKERVAKFNEKLSLFTVHRANKPSRAPFIKASRYLNIAPSEAAVIGDQIFTDILGGNRLGMFTILVTPLSQKEFPLIRVKRFLEKIVLRGYYRIKNK